MLDPLINLQEFSNPLNILLSMVLAYRLYKLIPSFRFNELKAEEDDGSGPRATSSMESMIEYQRRPTRFPESLVWRTYTPLELKEFDGNDGGKILFAVNRVVYDVSSGRNFYGPDGPYGNFAGRDASRGLAKQSFDQDMLTAVDSKIDTLEDLNDEERENLKGWEDLFKAKYIACGSVTKSFCFFFSILAWMEHSELIENSERWKKGLQSHPTPVIRHKPNETTQSQNSLTNSTNSVSKSVCISLSQTKLALTSSLSLSLSLSVQLVSSFERISILEDELHESRQQNHKLKNRVCQTTSMFHLQKNKKQLTFHYPHQQNAALELESAQHKEALKSGILVERAKIQGELQRLNQKVTQESEKRSQSEASLSTINQELDDLSASLFTEANRLVAAEKIQRIQAERKVMQVEEAMKRVEEIIEARRDQSNDLRLSLETAERERDQYKAECETLRNQLSNLVPDLTNGPNNPTSSLQSLAKSSSTASIVNSKESLATTPLLNNNSLSTPHDHHHHTSQFYPYFPLTPDPSDLQTIPQLKLSQEIIPFAEFLQFVQYLRRTREVTLTRSSQPPGLTESYYSAAVAITSVGMTTPSSTHPASSASPFLAPKDLLGPTLPLTQHLTQPFIKRCLDEDSDPTLRLDLAPGLNFMSRRSTLTALLEGNLIIEPIWSESGQASEFDNCTLCGCSLDSWLSARATSANSSHRNSSQSAGFAMRKMLRGGGWSFGGIGKPKRASHPVASTQPTEKSTLVPSVSLKLPSSGHSSPFNDSTSSLHIHTFKTVDGSSTRYPICPTYCLPRLRAACHFWTFIRSLERGVLLDESFWFTHYIYPPASNRLSETNSLGLAYDQALKRIRAQNHSIDSVDTPSIHSVRSSVCTPDNTLESSNQDDTSPVVACERTDELNLNQSKLSAEAESSPISTKQDEDETISDPVPQSSQTPDPVRNSQRSPSPSPTSTTEHDIVTQETVESDTIHHPEETGSCSTSTTVRPAALRSQVPTLSPAPSPPPRRSPSRSMSQSIISNHPSMLSKGISTNERSESASRVNDDYHQTEESREYLKAQSNQEEPRHEKGVIRDPPRSAPISSSQNGYHSRVPSQQTSRTSLEFLEAGWEEKCWQQVVKLKEEMFFKRVGLSLIPNK
ncbi:hypothetical protein VP01_41g2 [Puccinia sorghi]|uniref:Cytochrome b5 heme-binding domain-containing protein n=1 Tax=Puccinia sorghi TaxID=27349 RepID=A0A0L6UQR3_9BASI|nr:hypothetical protein VP01_41g2 [Puccinia sorghi]